MRVIPTVYDDSPDWASVHWSRERLRCARDFDHLCRVYLHIKSKHIIGFPTLRLNRVQRYLYEKMEAQRRRDGWVRQVWGKSRQVGATTLGEAWSFQNAAFKLHRNALLVVHDEPTVPEIFDISKTFYDALPDLLKPYRQYDTKTSMVFKKLNSRMVATHARNPDAGASLMYHIVHVTEAARYTEPERVQASLFPTISEAKGDDFSSVIVESTSVYGGDWFKEFAEAAQRGETPYEFTFVPWFWHKDYTAPVPKGFELTLEERERKRAFSLTDGQLAWWRAKQQEYITNPALAYSEYPYTFEESWLLPKGTLKVFDPDTLGRLREGVRPPLFRATPTASGLRHELGGPVEVWEEPQDGVFYDFGLDIAGESEHANWTAGCVIRRDTLAQVAGFRLRGDPTDPVFLDLVYWLGMTYHTAQLNPDITAGWGHALLRELMQRSYPNIWRWRQFDDVLGRRSFKLGFLFNQRAKRIIVTNMVTAARSLHPVVRSETLWHELCSYLTIGLDQWGAAPGETDDEVTAWMLALLAARSERDEYAPREIEAAARLKPGEPLSRKAALGEAAYHDIDADLAGVTERPLVETRGWGVGP